MKQTRIFVPLLIFFLLCGFALADPEDFGYGITKYYCKPSLYLYFANGMNNTRQAAKESLKDLKLLLKPRIDNRKFNWDILDSDIAHNYDSALPLELLEIYQQKKHESLDLFWQWLNDVETAPKWVIDIFRKYQETYQRMSISEQNLQEILQEYKSTLESRHKILTVGHSQGNLFANLVYNMLAKEKKDADRMALVAVATPASSVADGGPHITLTSDGVINMLRGISTPLTIRAPLPANFTNSSPKPGLFDHLFLKHYMKGVGSGKLIMDHMVDQINKLNEKKSNKRKILDYCLEWWHNIKSIDREDPDLCLLRCATAPVNMRNHDCLVDCRYLCNCDY